MECYATQGRNFSSCVELYCSDFTKFEESCLNHLKSTTETGEPYYKEIKPIELKPMIKAINKNMIEAFTTKRITIDEAEAMKAKERLLFMKFSTSVLLLPWIYCHACPPVKGGRQ